MSDEPLVIERAMWIHVDCWCCAGIEWGGEYPRECRDCGGSGLRWLTSRDRFALYPGGPFTGHDPGAFARALQRVGLALDAR